MPDFEVVQQLDLSTRYVVVAGGTQGIGAAISLLCARLGATVAIIGRNEALGQEAVNKLSAESKGTNLLHTFIPGDLSTVAGTKDVARKIKEWSGVAEIDVLFQSQGGPPSSNIFVTVDGVDAHFAVQVLSRFVLIDMLLKLKALKSDGTVVQIAGAGMGTATVDCDNVEAKGRHVWARMVNSPTVIDCFTKELLIRRPSLRTLHLHPGGVRTGVARNSNVPWLLAIPFKIMTLVPGLTRSPEEYAPIAVWTALSEEAKSQKGVWSWGPEGTEVKPSKASEDQALREKVWDRLSAMADEVET